MRSIYFVVTLVGAAILPVLYGERVAAAEAVQCFDDWSIAARIVKQEQLATVEELAGDAKRNLEGAIVRTSLCQEDGRYIYWLVIRDERGQLSRKRVDARNPF